MARGEDLSMKSRNMLEIWTVCFISVFRHRFEPCLCVCVCQESPSSWLDSALSHMSEIIQLEDVPSIQMEVGVLVREFPDVRYERSNLLLLLLLLLRWLILGVLT